MPLFDEHREEMRSQIGRPEEREREPGRWREHRAASSPRSSAILRGPYLDIAGTAYTSKTGACQPYGATGFGVRLVTELLQSWPRGGFLERRVEF